MPKCLVLRVIRLHIPLNPNNEKWQSHRAEDTRVEVDGPDVSSPDGQGKFHGTKGVTTCCCGHTFREWTDKSCRADLICGGGCLAMSTVKMVKLDNPKDEATA